MCPQSRHSFHLLRSLRQSLASQELQTASFLIAPLHPALYPRTHTSAAGRALASSSSIWQLVLDCLPDMDQIAYATHCQVLGGNMVFPIVSLLSFVLALVCRFCVVLSLDCSRKVSTSDLAGVICPETHWRGGEEVRNFIQEFHNKL